MFLFIMFWFCCYIHVCLLLYMHMYIFSSLPVLIYYNMLYFLVSLYILYYIDCVVIYRCDLLSFRFLIEYPCAILSPLFYVPYIISFLWFYLSSSWSRFLSAVLLQSTVFAFDWNHFEFLCLIIILVIKYTTIINSGKITGLKD